MKKRYSDTTKIRRLNISFWFSFWVIRQLRNMCISFDEYKNYLAQFFRLRVRVWARKILYNATVSLGSNFLVCLSHKGWQDTRQTRCNFNNAYTKAAATTAQHSTAQLSEQECLYVCMPACVYGWWVCVCAVVYFATGLAMCLWTPAKTSESACLRLCV